MEGIEEFRKAGKIVKTVREEVHKKVKEGARLMDVGLFVENRIKELGALPAFPVNVSVNEIAAHYTPNEEDGLVFKNGDLVKIDIGAHIDGYLSDSAVSVSVGDDEKNLKLIEAAEAALKAGIETAKPGCSLSKIGENIKGAIVKRGFFPIVNLTGHSMDRWNLHAGLSIANHPLTGGTLPKEIIVAIEPFSTDGAGKVIESKMSDIFRLADLRPQRMPRAKALLKKIYETYNTLPFARRWLDKKEVFYLPALLHSRALYNYPILREAAGGKVAQAEHTIYVGENEIEVLT